MEALSMSRDDPSIAQPTPSSKDNGEKLTETNVTPSPTNSPCKADQAFEAAQRWLEDAIYGTLYDLSGYLDANDFSVDFDWEPITDGEVKVEGEIFDIEYRVTRRKWVEKRQPT
jgi:hypothetical protein